AQRVVDPRYAPQMPDAGAVERAPPPGRARRLVADRQGGNDSRRIFAMPVKRGHDRVAKLAAHGLDHGAQPPAAPVEATVRPVLVAGRANVAAARDPLLERTQFRVEGIRVQQGVRALEPQRQLPTLARLRAIADTTRLRRRPEPAVPGNPQLAAGRTDRCIRAGRRPDAAFDAKQEAWAALARLRHAADVAVHDEVHAFLRR